MLDLNLLFEGTNMSEWWNKKSGAEKRAYIKAHPNSKYAGRSTKATGAGRAKEEQIKRRLKKHHAKLATFGKNAPTEKQLKTAQNKQDKAFMKTIMSPEAYKAYLKRSKR